MGSKKKIIVFANPFGFGPTGAAIALIKQLTISLANDAEIIYGASSKCLEPLSAKLRYKIRIEKINERNPAEISKILVKYKRPLVIVCLNRVAITTAKNLGLDAFFIDPLTWLRKRIPVDYLRANIYYAYDIFNAEQKIRGIVNAKLIPPALGVLPKHKIKKEDLTLIHIGGFTNPLVLGFSKEYLIMLAKAINDFAKRKQSTKGIITGGSEPLNFLKRYLRKNKNIFLGTLSRQEFLSTLNEASLFVTTPGLTAVLEAFALGTFVAFLPPTNLSQWAQLRLFYKSKGSPN